MNLVTPQLNAPPRELVSDQSAQNWIARLESEKNSLESLRLECVGLQEALKAGVSQSQDDLMLRLSQIQAMGTEIRRQRGEMAMKIKEAIGEPTNLTRLIQHVRPEYQSQLKKLRTQLQDKLLEIQTISFSNQIVMNYTMDFYHRLLEGVVGDTGGEAAMTLDGKLRPMEKGQLFTKNC